MRTNSGGLWTRRCGRVLLTITLGAAALAQFGSGACAGDAGMSELSTIAG
jgi:hypothetical protein